MKNLKRLEKNIVKAIRAYGEACAGNAGKKSSKKAKKTKTGKKAKKKAKAKGKAKGKKAKGGRPAKSKRGSVRLSILKSLKRNGKLSRTDLQKKVDGSPDNVNINLHVLAKSALIKKEAKRGGSYSITAKGKKELAA